MLDPEIAQMLQAMQDNGEPPLFQDTTASEARQRGVEIRARYYPPVLMDVARRRRADHPRPGRRHPGPGVPAREPHRRNGRLLPRRRLDHRRPGLARRPCPPAGRHRRRRRRSRGLPARPRAPVPGRLPGLRGGDRVGVRARRRARRPGRPDRRGRRQRRRQPRRRPSPCTAGDTQRPLAAQLLIYRRSTSPVGLAASGIGTDRRRRRRLLHRAGRLGRAAVPRRRPRPRH